MTSAEPVVMAAVQTPPPPPVSSGRAAGAELIRQLSSLKLEYFYQSHESLPHSNHHQAAVIKRFSDGHHERSGSHPRVSGSRPKLLRQQTTTGTEQAAPCVNRRQKLVQSGQSWRSYDAEFQRRGRSSRSDRPSRKSSSCSSPQRPRTAASSASLPLNSSAETPDVSPIFPEFPGSPVGTASAVAGPTIQRRSPFISCSSRVADGNVESNIRQEDHGPSVRYQKASDHVVLQQATCTSKKPGQESDMLIYSVSIPQDSTTFKSGEESISGGTSSHQPSQPNPRRVRGIVILTSVVLIFTCIFLVGFTLRLAPLIDELGNLNHLVIHETYIRKMRGSHPKFYLIVMLIPSVFVSF